MKTEPQFGVCIATYNRPDTIHEKTLAMLDRARIGREYVQILLHNQQQKELYEQNPKFDRWQWTITNASKGIREARNWAFRHIPRGMPILFLDDDLDAFQTKHHSKLVDVTEDLIHFVNEAFTFTKLHGLRLWGVYPVKNAFFMNSRPSTDLRFIIGQGFGCLVDPDIQLGAEVKEDYELSIRYFLADRGIVRFNHVCWKSGVYSGKGGIDYRDEECERRSIEYLGQNFPGYIRVRKKRNRLGHIEIDLVTPKQDVASEA